MLQQDLDTIDEVYVYVGLSAAEGAKALITGLVSQEKKVHMIACDCDQRTKTEFARELGIEIIWTTWCGGQDACGEIVREHSGV